MSELEQYREAIDALDATIIETLGRRFAVARDVARYKQPRGLAMYQPAREAQVRQRYVDGARAAGFSDEFADRLISLIFAEAHRLENEIMETPAESRG